MQHGWFFLTLPYLQAQSLRRDIPRPLFQAHYVKFTQFPERYFLYRIKDPIRCVRLTGIQDLTLHARKPACKLLRYVSQRFSMGGEPLMVTFGSGETKAGYEVVDINAPECEKTASHLSLRSGSLCRTCDCLPQTHLSTPLSFLTVQMRTGENVVSGKLEKEDLFTREKLAIQRRRYEEMHCKLAAYLQGIRNC